MKQSFRLLVTLLSFLSIPCLAQSTVDSPLIDKTAPDFEAMDQDGKMVKLSDYRGKSGVVLVFSRAHWCPYCMAQLKSIAKKKAQFKKAGYEIIAVLREENKGLEGAKKAEKSSRFPTLLLDTPTKVTKDYQHEGYATYIIDKSGKVKAVLSGPKTKRPTAEAILKTVQEL